VVRGGSWGGNTRGVRASVRDRLGPTLQGIGMAQLAVEVERVARKKHLTMSRALVVLAQRGVEAEAAEHANLNAAYRRFMAEADPERKSQAGKDLIRTVFGKDAIAEDPLL